MPDRIVPPSSEQDDSELRPAASLTAVPVRRRRRNGSPTKMLKAPPAASSTSAQSRAEEDGTGASPPEGIIALWESLAGEDSIPALLDLDVARIAARWPNSLLLRATGNPRRPQVEVARVFAANAVPNRAPLSIDTMMIDWMMALAREVTHDGVPVHELDNVSAEDPTAEYGLIALPFGASPNAVDHVLCHLYRYEGPSAEEEAASREPKEQPFGHKAGRKVMTSIFGRRQSAAG